MSINHYTAGAILVMIIPSGEEKKSQVIAWQILLAMNIDEIPEADEGLGKDHK
ncbi:MAG: hypothetical protein IIZ39_02330 [Blautia sp.]|nr:hypothetical protein [Blautia sp.]